MSAKSIYVAEGGLRLFTNLDWRVLDFSKDVGAGLRAAGSERGASHAAVFRSNHHEMVQVGKKQKKIQRTAGGFYSSADDSGPGKKGHSLAAAFAKWSAAHDKAALCMTLFDDGGFVVVVVINGLPVVDRYFALEEEAFALMGTYQSDHEDISVFADNQIKYPDTLMSDGLLKALLDSCDKTTLIKSIPVDSLKIAIALVVVVSLAGGYWYYNKLKKEKERKAAAAKLAQENPIPKYLSALEAKRLSLGFSRDSLAGSYSFAKTLLTDVDGWNLRKISCGREDSGAEGCTASYERKFGTYTDITKALPKLTLVNVPESLDLNVAVMSWKAELKPEPVSEDTISQDEFLRGATGSKMQKWLLAGIALQLAPPMLWPQVAGVPGSFRHPRALSLGKFSVSAMSLPIFEEVIKTAPANVIWSGFTINVGDLKQGADPLDAAKINMNGSYYVKY
jgi:hypothetical protein